MTSSSSLRVLSCDLNSVVISSFGDSINQPSEVIDWVYPVLNVSDSNQVKIFNDAEEHSLLYKLVYFDCSFAVVTTPIGK
jgi:hypothetical protein